MNNCESWVVLVYYEREPSEVYGLFPTEKAAIEWAEQQAKWGCAWEVKMVLDIEDEYWR